MNSSFKFLLTQAYLPIYTCIQWGEQVFDALLILQVLSLTKHVEVCNLYSSTVSDGI